MLSDEMKCMQELKKLTTRGGANNEKKGAVTKWS